MKASEFCRISLIERFMENLNPNLNFFYNKECKEL